MKPQEAKYCIGQVVHDPQFQFRGVIVDVDYSYAGTDKWYEKNAPHRPSKRQPWYHILVHNSDYRLYAAESSLEEDTSMDAVNHPEIDYFFSEFKNGHYILRRGVMFE
ncbi:MAG TPA: heat shock protein HspQ [Gammaproteobacteria bacterium]|nr:heat shock protein HspQ [Gammaproteobacteria bacterium]